MIKAPHEIRLALPSKGRLSDHSLDLLNRAGLKVYKPNPRQYKAVIPSLPDLSVIFQRVGDIVEGVRDGSVDFGITGRDVYLERRGKNGENIELHPALGFGHCTLNVIVPETWEQVGEMSHLSRIEQATGNPLRVATKYPVLTREFLNRHNYDQARLIHAEGTLEIAPEVGYADVIVDLVSSGTTLRDNRLKILSDGTIMESQACLIANKHSLKTNPKALSLAKRLLEFIVAHLRAAGNLAVFANIKGESPESIAVLMFSKEVIGGLQGPTLSKVITRDGEKWYAVHLIVRKDQLAQAIKELRDVGGSGVVVTPVTYIFEEEPHEYRNMLAALEG
jgi:ATP phosphoribosyltransferase